MRLSFPLGRRLLILTWIGFTSVATSPSSLSQTYRVLDLGTLGGRRSVAASINKFGQIVGYAETADGQHHAFLFAGGKMRDLGTLGGASSYAAVINDRSEVVGYSETANNQRHAFLYSRGTMRDLGTLGGGFSSACLINNRGKVVGSSTIPCGCLHAFVYHQGRIIDIDKPADEQADGYSEAVAVNDLGQVAGHVYIQPHSGTKRAFLATGNSVKFLGPLGGSTRATGLNNRGEVVGYSETSNSELHAFLYANGQIRDLGALPGGTQSLAYGLNKVGQIVGAADDAAGGLRAVLYDGVRLRNLNTLVRNGAGWVLRVATAINDVGEIVGEGAFQGEEHAFLLTPETVPRGKSLSSTTVSLKESRREPK